MYHSTHNFREWYSERSSEALHIAYCRVFALPVQQHCSHTVWYKNSRKKRHRGAGLTSSLVVNPQLPILSKCMSCVSESWASANYQI